MKVVVWSALIFTLGSCNAAEPPVPVAAVASVQALPTDVAPTDADVEHAGMFDEPIVPVGRTTADDDLAAAATLRAYRDAVARAGVRDAVEPIVGFLDQYPRSPWAPALLYELGKTYRQTGHMSRALATWRRGWRLTEHLTDPNGRAIGDATAASLSQFEAYLGRKELLSPLLDSLRHRELRGTAAELVSESSRGLAEMIARPEVSFKCGPMALYRIELYRSKQLDPKLVHAIEEARSSSNGMALPAVRDLSYAIGMNYQMAFRSPGAPMILPAVVHWKVGHYAAVVDRVDGRYLIEDSTFGENIRVDPATFDDETSGYFLVPAGRLPDGWRAVSVEEGNHVWGRGNTGGNHDNGGTGPDDGKNGPSGGGPGDGGPPCGDGCTVWNIQPMVVGLALRDIPVGYNPPVGPDVKFGVVYAHRDALQPAVFDYGNVGSKWTSTWTSYVTDNVSLNGTATLYRRGGGSEPYTFPNRGPTSKPAPFSEGILTRQVAGTATTGFTRQLRDGSIEGFTLALGTRFFLTSVSDPHGNTATLGYDAQDRLVTITDAIGQVTTLAYELAADPLKVTKVTDPFGRAASFTYAADGHLASITDVLGITSSYAYGGAGTGGADFIHTLTTPYGVTTFTYGDSTTDSTLGTTRFVTATDPLGRTTRVEFRALAPGIASKDPPALVPTGIGVTNDYLQWRDTFVWNPVQLAAATTGGSLDYTKARILHWLHTSDMQATSRVLESRKEPLENRVWYRYADESSSIALADSALPTASGRVLDDGTTRIEQWSWDMTVGAPLTTTDPNGRHYRYTYGPGGVDLVSIANTTASEAQVLTERAYDTQHDLVSLVDASGQKQFATYNARGQATRTTDARGDATNYSYDSNGYLTQIERPGGATYTFTYDPFGRVTSVTPPSQGTTTYAYDAADRIVSIGYPDGTTKQLGYDLLELASITDRLGHTTQLAYDADRELTQTTDALANATSFAYSSAGKLASITDARGSTTVFTRDLQDRVIGRRNVDGTEQTFAYELATSRTHSVTDAAGQSVIYAYNPDDTIARIDYEGAVEPTPSVALTYDPLYARVTQMTDGTGTTTFAYTPIGPQSPRGANRLSLVASPIAGADGGVSSDIVNYGYDELGRVVVESIEGLTAQRSFDSQGRLATITNALDTFTYGYVDPTPRVASIATGQGPQIALAYNGPEGDGLLNTITVTNASGDPLAQLGYTYDADDRVTNLVEQYAGAAGADQPKLVASGGTTAPFELILIALALAALVYARRHLRWLRPALIAYAAACSGDHAAPHGTAITTAYTRDDGGRLVSATTTALPGNTDTTAAAAYAYTYDASSNLTSITANGANTALEYDDRDRLTNASYDANGNLTAFGDARYTWDAANRLVSISSGDAESDLTYDGIGRLVRIVDKQQGAVAADHAYLWCGMQRCLERDNLQPGSPITKRYFPQGVQIGDDVYYYVTDQLGSVRQLVDRKGVVRAQYAYDPYGNQTKISGDVDSDFTYAGMFHHAASGLDLAVFRAYAPQLGRWLSRDPIGFAGGQVNLFAYVGGDPVSVVDPSGLFNPYGLLQVASYMATAVGVSAGIVAAAGTAVVGAPIAATAGTVAIAADVVSAAAGFVYDISQGESVAVAGAAAVGGLVTGGLVGKAVGHYASKLFDSELGELLDPFADAAATPAGEAGAKAAAAAIEKAMEGGTPPPTPCPLTKPNNDAGTPPSPPIA